MKETNKSSELTSQLNRIDGAFAFKVNDRYSEGYSDIHGTYLGMSFFFEAKTTDDHSKNPIALKHKFSPLQVLFLDDAKEAGALAIGVIYANDNKKWYYCEPEDIKKGIPIKIMEVENFGSLIKKRYSRHIHHPEIGDDPLPDK